MVEFHWPVRVYYEDTDAGGVVYYANYLKFMERARTEWLRRLGFEQDRLREEAGVVFAVHTVHVRYLHPARFNELLHVTVKIAEQGRTSLAFEQDVRAAAGEPLFCTGSVRVVCLDVTRLRPHAIPQRLLQELAIDH
ncbi:MAG: tol-pal system-associated acyl-CoA thioesterase [Gammaproteobacteria bacterium]|nr:tol-pal system-associated acyl-CoA thioesterase [Gammaproteobacteria bacterium]